MTGNKRKYCYRKLILSIHSNYCTFVYKYLWQLNILISSNEITPSKPLFLKLTKPLKKFEYH